MSIEKKRKVWTQIIIMTIVLGMMIAIWPAKLIKHTISSEPMEDAAVLEKEFTQKDKLLQTFTPQCDYVKQIRLYASCQGGSTEEIVTFVLYNSQYAPVFQEEYSCEEIARYGYLTVKTELALAPGEVCYYELILPEDAGEHLTISLGDRNALGQIENGILFENGTPDMVHSYRAEYSYVQPLSKLRTIVYYVAILVIGGILYFGITNLWSQFPENFARIGKYLQIIAALIVAGLVMVALYFAVLKNIFGGALLDRMVYAMGIVSAGIWMWIALYHKKPTYVEAVMAVSIEEVWRGYLQTLCFAGVIYANCMYSNATELKYQYENTRWMLVFLGLVFVTYLRVDFHDKTDRIFMGLQLAWLLGSVFYALRYISYYREDAHSHYLAKLYMAVMVIWGVVILYAFRCLCRRKLRDSIQGINWLQWLQIGLAFLFTIGMCMHRYKKVWPFEIVVPILVLLLMGLGIRDKERMLRNLCNGILLSFVIVTGKALLYRPYMKWTYYRYPGYFHTVACTGMFLTIVVCAALVKYYIRAKGSEHIFRDTWKEIFFCSVALVYVFLTMSRTAIMALVVLLAGVVILTGILHAKKGKQILLEVGLLAGITIATFPMVYSATRMIPAIVNKPYRFEPVEPTVEEFSAMIVEGDGLDSDKYMNMERFITLFAARIHLPEILTVKEEAKEEKEMNQAVLTDNKQESVPLQEDTSEERAVATVSDEPAQASGEADKKDTFEVSKGLTNGRMDIFQAYITAFNMAGHEKMGYQSVDGTKDYGHAHNSYIQVMYDFGIPTGILFLLLCLVTFINTIYITVKVGNRMEYALLLFGLVVVFGVVSVTEWAFHPSIPIGFTFIWSVGLLMGIDAKNKVQK